VAKGIFKQPGCPQTTNEASENRLLGWRRTIECLLRAVVISAPQGDLLSDSVRLIAIQVINAFGCFSFKIDDSTLADAGRFIGWPSVIAAGLNQKFTQFHRNSNHPASVPVGDRTDILDNGPLSTLTIRRSTGKKNI
jgi:hypothetical protein